MRVPVTLLQTNACSPLATNAIADNIWDNFSSQTYKDLPSVGTITVYNPFTGEAAAIPDAGRRPRLHAPASLISLWSTAPFLLNNTRRASSTRVPRSRRGWASFQDSIEQMLWPEKRDKDPVLGDKVPGVIDRTTQLSYLRVPDRLSARLRCELPPLSPGTLVPGLVGEDGIEIGPIPKGTPVTCWRT